MWGWFDPAYHCGQFWRDHNLLVWVKDFVIELLPDGCWGGIGPIISLYRDWNKINEIGIYNQIASLHLNKTIVLFASQSTYYILLVQCHRNQVSICCDIYSYSNLSWRIFFHLQTNLAKWSHPDGHTTMILPIGVISITYVHRYMSGFRIVDKLKLRGVNFNRNCAKQTLSVCKYEIPEEFFSHRIN